MGLTVSVDGDADAARGQMARPVQPLTGGDRFHLYTESAVQPMHTLKVLIVDPSGGPHMQSRDALHEWLDCAVANVPPLRWRLVTAPFGLGAPAWIDAGRVDVTDHFRFGMLDHPGGREELARFHADLLVEPLDRTRPLWQFWLVEGLAHGRVAHIWKVHHALADGTSSARILGQIYQHEPLERAHRPEASPLTGSPLAQVLVRDAMRMHARLIAGLPDLTRRSYRARNAVKLRRRAGLPSPARSRSGPITRYNRGLTAKRTCAFITVSLTDLKMIRHAFGYTLNDVFLAVAAGALRTHLERQGELPELPLTASVPVSTRKPEEATTYGNRVGLWNVSVPTHVADPVERLEAAHTSARGAREVAATTGLPYLLAEWQAHALIFKPLTTLGGAMPRLPSSRPYYNVTLSNVPGPRTQLFANGAPVIELHSLSVLTSGQGLNLTGWSYRDDFSVGLVSCPELEPEIWALANRIPESVAELVAAARQHRTESARRGFSP